MCYNNMQKRKTHVCIDTLCNERNLCVYVCVYV